MLLGWLGGQGFFEILYFWNLKNTLEIEKMKILRFLTRLKGFSPNRGKRLEGLGVLQGLGALEAGGLGGLG